MKEELSEAHSSIEELKEYVWNCISFQIHTVPLLAWQFSYDLAVIIIKKYILYGQSYTMSVFTCFFLHLGSF